MNVSDLMVEYPELFWRGDEEGHFIGFSCGLGWFAPIASLMSLLEARRLDGSRDRPLKIVQLKEKFGELRIYRDGGDEKDRQLIEMCMALADRMCDVCGAPGEKRGPGWIRTRCDKHIDERPLYFEPAIDIREELLAIFEGDQARADRWLRQSQDIFEGRTAQDMMGDLEGALRVRRYLMSVARGGPW